MPPDDTIVGVPAGNPELSIADSSVVIADVLATNGIIHVIVGVLLP